MTLFKDKYSGIIIDVWGVIHDGEKSLPGAQEFLDMLCEKNYPHVILTNSPRRSCFIENVFKKLNLSISDKSKIISCGEIIHDDFKNKVLFKYKKQKREKLKVFEIDIEKTDFFNDLKDIDLIDKVEDADLVFFQALNENMLNYVLNILEIAKKNHIPILCANPDTSVYSGNKKIIRPGRVLKDYKGIVIHYGKPYGRIYSEAFKHLNVYDKNILSIGDNFLTDGMASSNYGMDFYLINSNLAKDTVNEVSNGNIKIEKSYDSLESLCNF